MCELTEIKTELPFQMKYPYRVLVNVEWPSELEFEGAYYWPTGKVGTATPSGEPSAEYKTVGDNRVWLNASTGEVTKE